MGTKVDQRVSVATTKVRFLINQGGPVAQLLHPDWTARDDPNQIGGLLLQAEELLSAQAPNVELVLTGAGFLEVPVDGQRSYRYWRTEAALERLFSQCKDVADPVLSRLRHATRDYLFGVDFVSGGHGGGQFARLARAGKAHTIVWKSYPVGAEGNTLAGFGTGKGRLCPRVFNSRIGRA